MKAKKLHCIGAFGRAPSLHNSLWWRWRTSGNTNIWANSYAHTDAYAYAWGNTNPHTGTNPHTSTNPHIHT